MKNLEKSAVLSEEYQRIITFKHKNGISSQKNESRKELDKIHISQNHVKSNHISHAQSV